MIRKAIRYIRNRYREWRNRNHVPEGMETHLDDQGVDKIHGMINNTPSLGQIASGKKPHRAAKTYACIRKLTVKQLRPGRHRTKSVNAARSLLRESNIDVRKVSDGMIVKALTGYLKAVPERYRNQIDGRQMAKVIMESMVKEGA